MDSFMPPLPCHHLHHHHHHPCQDLFPMDNNEQGSLPDQLLRRRTDHLEVGTTVFHHLHCLDHHPPLFLFLHHSIPCMAQEVMVLLERDPMLRSCPTQDQMDQETIQFSDPLPISRPISSLLLSVRHHQRHSIKALIMLESLLLSRQAQYNLLTSVWPLL